MGVTIRLDRFAREALQGVVPETGDPLAHALDPAVRYYLGDAGCGRVAWRVPLLTGRVETSELLELELDDGLDRKLRREARLQNVSPEAMVLHALMYYLADVDSGRAANRLA